MTSLDLAPIGNCTVSALIDHHGRFVWGCVPRVDGEPVFCALLGGADPAAEQAMGTWCVDLDGLVSAEQRYERNSAVLRTRLTDDQGGIVEISDFCPRFKRSNRTYRPIAYVRIVTPIAGSPRIRVRLAAARGWGREAAARTWGSNHIRYMLDAMTLRLSTTAPISHVLQERYFRLEEEQIFFLGPDEPFDGDIRAVVRGMREATVAYWREWVRTLATPLNWQEAVIRAAITLKLCVYEETGAIVAALTTSVPEAPNTARNWDYRFCWLRDAYYTIQALNRLGAAEILEGYLAYLRNIVDAASRLGAIQPVYGVGTEPVLAEQVVGHLSGYRGMGPVRIGNAAHLQAQHDVYGQIILSSVQAFFDTRLFRPAGKEDFLALERVGEHAYAAYLTPDAGPWEFRTRRSIHTYSALMCWAGCDRLAKAADHLGLSERSAFWRRRSDDMRAVIEKRAWNEGLHRFAATFDGGEMDASLLQLMEVRFLDADDDRFVSTLGAVERELRRGDHVLRYASEDDFGEPSTAFNFCVFWLIEALHRGGRAEDARDLFVRVLERRTSAGLLSEDCDLATGEPWGNYPQTYSLAGLINCATLLSEPWSSVR
ncbi:MAG: glycoside hydrolase family 15 protein [Hyphomonadaceae bacterium]